ncbi:hypothetical protein GCM10023089_37710 [Quisquiliibacterium transsilvanicum]|uniref:diguanylate cyclase n=1 Tax=Quisquiliibacterium transsilvanicum TaxID=1549638 RepID=A0A7W8HJC7_9BURK|nr:diguanylate cyclase (GGDEF)-like protein [Quisquiliibacterium transsilvanicum]
MAVQGEAFAPSDGNRLNFGLVKGAVWLRFVVEAGSGCHEPVFLKLGNPFGNRVSVFRRVQGEGWTLEASPLDPVTGAGQLQIRQAMVPVNPLPDHAAEYLIRVAGPGPVLAAPTIVSGRGLADEVGDRTLLGGLLAGGIVSLVAYCAVLARLTRLRGLWAYSASALALALFYGIASGVFDRALLWLLPAGQDPFGAVQRVSGFAVAIAALFHWFFVRGLLAADAASWRKPWHAALLFGWLALAISLPFAATQAIALLSVAVTIAALVAVAAEIAAALRRAHPLARATAVAFGSLAVAATGFVAMYLGLLPWWPALIHATALGVWAEAILLSVAVGSQVRDLRGERQRLAERTQELSRLSQRDALTGLGNRRAYDRTVPETLDRCRRAGAAVSLLVVDIDHFKEVNDRHGHGFGDQVIQALSATVTCSIRTSDFAFRYGGEEFVLLLPGLAMARALEVAERVRSGMRDSRRAAPDGSQPVVSVSVGVAQMQPGDTAETLFARADAALYRAKAAGRDRVELETGGAGGAGAGPSGARFPA